MSGCCSAIKALAWARWLSSTFAQGDHPLAAGRIDGRFALVGAADDHRAQRGVGRAPGPAAPALRRGWPRRRPQRQRRSFVTFRGDGSGRSWRIPLTSKAISDGRFAAGVCHSPPAVDVAASRRQTVIVASRGAASKIPDVECCSADTHPQLRGTNPISDSRDAC